MATEREIKIVFIVSFVALLAGIAGIVLPLQPSAQIGTRAVMYNGIHCDSGETNCVESWNGMNIDVFSDQGTTRKFRVLGASGNTTIVGTLAVTGAETHSGAQTINNNLTVTGTTNLQGATTISNTLLTTGAATINNNATITGTLGVTGATTQSGALTVNNNATVTGTLAVTGAQTNSAALTVNNNATITGTLALGANNATFTGPIKYGTAANYTSGASITHGFATTPTMCLMSPGPEITATYTITATGFSSNTSTRSNPIYWLCGQ